MRQRARRRDLEQQLHLGDARGAADEHHVVHGGLIDGDNLVRRRRTTSCGGGAEAGRGNAVVRAGARDGVAAARGD